jgi:hypothetical protein
VDCGIGVPHFQGRQYCGTNQLVADSSCAFVALDCGGDIWKRFSNIVVTELQTLTCEGLDSSLVVFCFSGSSG